MFGQALAQWRAFSFSSRQIFQAAFIFKKCVAWSALRSRIHRLYLLYQHSPIYSSWLYCGPYPYFHSFHSNLINTSVTFATAAVRSYISTVSRNSTAAAVFLRLHTLAVTFATAAVRRIFNLWRQKNCGCPTSFEMMTHGRRRASLRQP